MLKKIISFALCQLLILAVLAGSLTVSAAYENTYVNTGNGQNDIVGVAKTQVGYDENTEQYTGYTKYGDWYHTYMKTDDSFIAASWCAMFVSWCSYQAGTIGVTGSYAYCPYWVSHFKDIKKWQSRSSGYIPVAGDIIFYSDDGVETGTASHVGIVYASNRSTVYTIEGNTADSCAYRSYSLEDTYIIGYGTPGYTGRVYTEIPPLPTPVSGEKVYITSYNTQMFWGAAVVFDKKFNGTNTAAYNELGISWSSYFVAEPTSEKDVYRITLVGQNLQSGSLTIPEGGIIFAGHCDDRDTNSDAYKNSSANRSAVLGFKTGDCVRLNGVDLTTGTISATATLEKTSLVEKKKLELKQGASLSVDSTKGFVLGVHEGDTPDEIKAQFSNINVQFDKTVIGTGCKVSITSGGVVDDSLTIIVAGDLSGDGIINAQDYLMLKRAFLGTLTLNEAQLKAGCLSGGTNIVAGDYLKIKRHFLGTYNIFS